MKLWYTDRSDNPPEAKSGGFWPLRQRAISRAHMTRPYIVFVYNADSGIFNTASDIAHKIFSPETYECNLCAITYGNFSIRTKWKEFLETLDADLEFLHRNELAKKYGVKSVQLPAVFLKKEDCLQELISADVIKKCHNIKDLKILISWKLSLLPSNPTKNIDSS